MIYGPLRDILKQKGWKVNPLLTLTMGVRGAIHKHYTVDF